MVVDPDVERVILEFHKAGKPLALCCIAPILAAKVLGKVPVCTSTIEIQFLKHNNLFFWPF
jgi:enhancing lycopene biosynthesis protein 2